MFLIIFDFNYYPLIHWTGRFFIVVKPLVFSNENKPLCFKRISEGETQIDRGCDPFFSSVKFRHMWFDSIPYHAFVLPYTPLTLPDNPLVPCNPVLVHCNPVLLLRVYIVMTLEFRNRVNCEQA